MHRLVNDPLLRAWGALMALIAAATAIALTPLPAGWPEALRGALILLIAALKARIILSRYLGLWRAPWWLGGFSGAVALLLIALFLLRLILLLR